MSPRVSMLLAAFGSAALLAGAFVFQYAGYAPCQLCLWQRWPHAAATGLGGLVLVLGPKLILALAGAGATLATAGIGLYHTGVERGWWAGPASCSGGETSLSGLSGADLLSLDVENTIIMCDEVAWAMFGLSMASWNMAASLALTLLWISAARRAD